MYIETDQHSAVGEEDGRTGEAPTRLDIRVNSAGNFVIPDEWRCAVGDENITTCNVSHDFTITYLFLFHRCRDKLRTRREAIRSGEGIEAQVERVRWRWVPMGWAA